MDPIHCRAKLDLGLDRDEPDELHNDLARLSAETKLVLVAYACAQHSGVVRLEWGSAELRSEDRSLIWHHHEALPVPPQPTAV